VSAPETEILDPPVSTSAPARAHITSQHLHRAARVLRSSVALGLVLALLSWPFTASDLSPTTGVDPSWQAALEMAARAGLPFGSHMVFAYGPLGFLSVWSIYYPVIAVLSFAFLLGLQSILFAVILERLRRSMPFIVSLVLAYAVGTVAIAIVAVNFSGGPEKILPLFFIGCVALLTRTADQPATRWTWISLGVALSLFSLIKVSLAAPMVAALVITVWCSTADRRRAIGSIALGAVPTFVIGWFATGNGLSNLYSFAHGSYSIIGGYASALSTEAVNRGDNYWWAALCALTVAAIAVVHCRSTPRRVQVGAGLLTVLFLWDLFREGFVRHDSFHDPVFFASMPILLVAFVPWKRHWGWLSVGIVTTTVIAMIAVGSWPSLLFRPDLGLRNVAHEVETLVSPSRRDSVIQSARRSMQSQYNVPQTMLAAIGTQSVVVEPWEQGLVWAYGLNFDPMPAFRDGYTTYLDQLDAHDLATSNAPHFILRWLPSNYVPQYQTFDRPSTQIALECDYREVQADSFWQLLVHVKNRCGTQTRIGTVSVGLGQWIDVPQAPHGDAIVATFTLPLGLWWHFADLLFKPPTIGVSINGGSGNYRFIPGTAGDPHLLVVSQNLKWDSTFVPLDISSIAFSVGGQGFGTTGVTATFYEVPMSP
jgi:hypothetical protein